MSHRLPSRSRVLVIAVCGLMAACGGSDGPTSPSAGSFAGQWIGTTAQGTPIAFTVSSDDAVTSITIGYSFNGCSGSQTFSNLHLETAPNVMCIPGPCPSSVSTFRRFAYATGPIEGPITRVNGLFLSTTRAEGSAGFMEYPGCGSANGIPWTAVRR